MSDNALVKQVFSLSERVRKEAKALDKLPGAALAAVLGGSLVIGAVGGGLFWIPAAMAGGMFAYRSVLTAIEYPQYRKRQRIEDIEVVRVELERITKSPLEIEFKEQLSRAVVLEVLPPLSGSGHEPPALEHKKD